MPNRPGRSVKAEQDGRAYSAWVPDPLPPSVDLDATLARALESSSAALGELAGTGRNLPNPHLLLSPFLRKEAVLSSRIEGTQATITDLYAYEAAQLPLPGVGEPAESPGDVVEVLNYVRALNRGLVTIADQPVTLTLVLDLHRELMQGVRGRDRTPGHFRTAQNIIGPTGATLQTATYIPPPVTQMKDALLALETYIRSGTGAYPRLIELAMIHYQFEAIHPFNDGNGRVGRLLLSLLLVHWGLLPLPLLYLSAYFEQDRGAYYDGLQGVTEQGEWRGWILYFLSGIESQARDAAARAKRLHDLREQLQDRIAAARMQAVTGRLVSALFQQPVITISAAAELMGGDVTYHLARRHVHKLVEHGILEPAFQRGHQEFYVAREIVDAVER